MFICDIRQLRLNVRREVETEIDDFHWQNPCILFAYLGIKNVVLKPTKQKFPTPSLTDGRHGVKV